MYDKDTQLLAETYEQIQTESLNPLDWIPDLGIMNQLYWIGHQAVAGVMGAVIGRYLGQFLEHLAQKYAKKLEVSNASIQTARDDVGYGEFERRRNEAEAKIQPKTPKKFILKKHGEKIPLINTPNVGKSQPEIEMPLQQQMELRMKIADQLQKMYPVKDRTFWSKLLEKAAKDLQTKYGMIAFGVLTALFRALLVPRP